MINFFAVLKRGIEQQSGTGRGMMDIPAKIIFLVNTYFVTGLFDNYISSPVLFVLPLIAVAGLVGIKAFYTKGYLFRSFVSSCITIVFVCFTGIAGLFPNLIPSNLDTKYSLTIYNSSSSHSLFKALNCWLYQS